MPVPPTPSPDQGSRRSPYELWAGGALLSSLLVVVILSAWVSDDAYFSFRSSWNLAYGHGLGFDPSERVQAFTNPLWTLLLAPPQRLGLDAYHAAMLLSLGSTGAVGWLFLRSHKLGTAAIAIGLLTCSKAFVDFSTSGLEGPATHLLVLLLFLEGSNGPESSPRSRRTGVLAGLLLLNRLDSALLVGPILLHRLARSSSRDRVNTLVPVVVIIGSWEVFSLIYYGTFLPNTYFAKLGGGAEANATVGQGLTYLAQSLDLDWVTTPTLVLGLAAGIFGKSSEGRTWALTIVLFCSYVVLVGGDFMSGRFLTAPFLLATALLVQRIADRAPGRTGPVLAFILLAGLLSPGSPLRTGPSFGTDRSPELYIDSDGIADERAFYYPRTGLLRPRNGGPLSPAPMHRTSEPTLTGVRRDNGALYPYEAGPGMHFIGEWALADAFLARLPPPDPRGRPGHVIRPIPSGYDETLDSGKNRIEDPEMARIFDETQQVVAGPLWTTQRWRLIWEQRGFRANF